MKYLNNISGIIIICIGLFVTSMVVWTVYKAISHPVQMENLYQSDYHSVDYTYNDIRRDIALFNTKYTLDINTKELNRGTNQILLSVVNKQTKQLQDTNITLLLTRPHTNNENQDILISKIKDQYSSEIFNIKNIGRYKFLIQIKIDDIVAHLEYKFFVK